MSRHGQPLDIRSTALALLALLGLALALPATALAAEPVGRIIARSGGVSAIDEGGDRRRLDRRDPVYAGDTIRTGPRGRAQIRFVDSGMVDLEPRTRFGIDEYRQEQDGGNVVLNFLAGALRAVTGAIGDRDEDEYRMNTPVATIGVRGTAYALRYCDAECAERTGGQVGLYGRVEDDFIVVDTPGGTATFGEGEYFYVPEGGPPEGIVAPPDGILDGGDDQPGGDSSDLPDVGIRPGDEEDDERFRPDAGEDIVDRGFEQEDTFPVGAGGEGMVGSYVTAGQGGFGATTHTDPQRFQESGGIIESFDVGDGGTVAAGSATLVDVQSFDGLGVVTGRWTGLIDPPFSGPTDGDMHFAWTDNLISSEQLSALSGSISYSLTDARGPDIFDNGGTQWFTDTVDMTVDFTAVSVSLDTFTLSPDPTADLSTATFSGADTSNLSADGEFTMTDFDAGTLNVFGQIVGGNGEGIIISFDAAVSGVELSGVRVLEP